MGSELVSETGISDVEFWDSRPLLRQVKLVASKTRKSPYAILGWLMVEMLTRLSYKVNYVSEVGTASLNMLFLMSAPTGGGKSAARRVAKEYFEFETIAWSHCEPIQAGSGEGIADSFFERKKTTDDEGNDVWEVEWINPHHCRVFYNDEISFHKGKAHQNSSTLEATYLSMYSGDLLGRSLAGGRGTEVPAGEYRAIAVFNAQPENDPFRNDASKASGMPSRLLNLNAINPNARLDYAQVADVPLLSWQPYKIPSIGSSQASPQLLGGVELVVPHISNEPTYFALPEMNLAHAEEDFLASEGLREYGRSHTLLTRAKVTCVLAALDGRAALNIEDWHLAGHLIDHSNAMDDAIQKVISRAQRTEAGKSGAILGVKMDAADASKEEAALLRVISNVRKWAAVEGYDLTQLPHEGNNPAKRSAIESHISNRDRGYIETALLQLHNEHVEGGEKNG